MGNEWTYNQWCIYLACGSSNCFQIALESMWLLAPIAGKIPLRQLVYRVLDLPPSMRPLVYDFGKLTTQTEEDYTKQIVLDHVSDYTGSVLMIVCAASVQLGFSMASWLTVPW